MPVVMRDLSEKVGRGADCPMPAPGTTKATERLYLESRRRIKTPGHSARRGPVLALLYGLLASGQIRFPKLDGWQDMATPLTAAPSQTGQAA